MKNLSTILFGIAVAFGANAADFDLMPCYSPDLCWSGASMTDKVITWENAWGGLVFNMENKDYAAYDYVVMDLAEPSTTKLKMEVYYADESSASSSAEFEVGSKKLKLDLSELKTNIQKIALMSAKPATATLQSAVLTDIFVSDPVLWEGSFDIPNMNVTNFTIKGDKFASLKAGDKLTVYFNVGDAENYGTIQLCYGWTKLSCDANRTNTNNSGNYATTATETSVVITDEGDIEGLKKSGLRIKGKNVIIKKVMLTPEGTEPTPPEDLNPGDDDENNGGETTDPGCDLQLWSGSQSTGVWENDITVDAPKFIAVKAGDIISIDLKVNEGADFGNIEIDDQNYNKLECDGKGEGLNSYSCIDPTVSNLKYTVTADDASKLKSNGLRVKGANITLTAINLIAGEGSSSEPGDVTMLWSGSQSTGVWENDITVDAPKFSSVKGGDKIIVGLSVNEGSDYGNIEMDDQNYSKLGCDGKGDGLDSYGCVQPDVAMITYTLTNQDATLLKSNGLRVKGANITVTSVALEIGEALPDDPEPANVEELWSGNVNCGQWKQTVSVAADKFVDAKEGDTFTIYGTKNAGAGRGTLEVQANNGTTLSCNGQGTNLDGSGNLVKGATEVTYTINADDLALLKTHGLLVKGFAVTLTKITLNSMETSGVDDIFEEAVAGETPVEYYNLQGVRVMNPGKGLFIMRQGNKVKKVIL